MHLLRTFFLLSFSASLLAQGYYYGRNKVQYTDFNWQVMETEHFDIYYYPEMEEIAKHGAQYAEESFKALEPKFNYSVTRRIPLIFYSAHLYFQQTNVTPGLIPEGVGGFFEFLKGRVVIPSNGDLAKFRHVIRHELVHVFMHGKIRNVLRNQGKTDGPFPPLWFTEGLAEHWSAEWDAQAEMVIKDAVLDNYVVGLENIYQIAGTFTMYKLGQHLLDYVEKTYGDDKILMMMENLWKFDFFQDSFRDAIGKDYAEFDKEYLIALKEEYYPQLANDDFNSTQGKTVVRDGFNLKPAYYKELGEDYVVFVGNRTGYSSIFMKPMSETNYQHDEDVEVLIKGEASSDFESFHLFDSKIDVNSDGLLTFTSKSGEADNLYIYDIPSRKILSKHNFKDLVGLLSPAWSPDGKEIVFSGLSKSGFSDIYIFNRESEELIQLTNDFYNDATPSWAPDGKHIAFSSDRCAYGPDGASNIFIMNKSGQDMRYLTFGRQTDQSPVFSPNGKMLAFTSDESGSYNIHIVKDPLKTNGSLKPIHVSKITNSVGAIFDPEWTNNNDLLFGTFEQRSFQIRLIDDIEELVVAGKKADQPIEKPLVDMWNFGTIHSTKIQDNKSYEKQFELDIVQTQVSQDPIFGTSGGAQIAFTDMLGNEQYNVLVYNSDRYNSNLLESLSFAATKINLGEKINYAYGIYRFAGTFYNRQDSYYIEDRAGAMFAISYPFSKFERIEFNQNFSYSDKNLFFEKRYSWLNASFLSYVYDNSIWTYTGPIDGYRIKFTIGNTYDFAFSNVNYLTGLIDARYYYRTSLRSAYAVRLLSLFNEGKESRLFYFGGSWDLRGYDRFSLRGRRVFLLSQEFRFPLIDLIGVKLPVFSLGFYQIRGALFFDIGRAWDRGFDKPRASFGTGIRLPLGFIALRWDFGKKVEDYKIQKGYFTQFFFGWDF